MLVEGFIHELKWASKIKHHHVFCTYTQLCIFQLNRTKQKCFSKEVKNKKNKCMNTAEPISQLLMAYHLHCTLIFSLCCGHQLLPSCVLPSFLSQIMAVIWPCTETFCLTRQFRERLKKTKWLSEVSMKKQLSKMSEQHQTPQGVLWECKTGRE